MIFVAHVTYYFEGEDKVKNAHCFVPAEKYAEVVDYLTSFYGEEYIEEMTIESFSPSSLIEFEGDEQSEDELFFAVYNTLKEKVVW